MVLPNRKVNSSSSSPAQSNYPTSVRGQPPRIHPRDLVYGGRIYAPFKARPTDICIRVMLNNPTISTEHYQEMNRRHIKSLQFSARSLKSILQNASIDETPNKSRNLLKHDNLFSLYCRYLDVRDLARLTSICKDGLEKVTNPIIVNWTSRISFSNFTLIGQINNALGAQQRRWAAIGTKHLIPERARDLQLGEHLAILTSLDANFSIKAQQQALRARTMQARTICAICTRVISLSSIIPPKRIPKLLTCEPCHGQMWTFDEARNLWGFTKEQLIPSKEALEDHKLRLLKEKAYLESDKTSSDTEDRLKGVVAELNRIESQLSNPLQRSNVIGIISNVRLSSIEKSIRYLTEDLLIARLKMPFLKTSMKFKMDHFKQLVARANSLPKEMFNLMQIIHTKRVKKTIRWIHPALFSREPKPSNLMLVTDIAGTTHATRLYPTIKREINGMEIITASTAAAGSEPSAASSSSSSAPYTSVAAMNVIPASSKRHGADKIDSEPKSDQTDHNKKTKK